MASVDRPDSGANDRMAKFLAAARLEKRPMKAARIDVADCR